MDWKEYLAGVDDDYLIGLSNKGIVKRSYKDMETAKAAVVRIGENIVMAVDGETCIIKNPLGESTCTCPSRTICRHVVQSVLVLKEYVMMHDDKKSSCDVSEEAREDNRERGQEHQEHVSAPTLSIWEEIKAFPLEVLKKALGSRGFQTFVNQVLSGKKPQIINTSIVTVQLPGQETTVKLLSPLEYSSCTCHKKEMCVHKAMAILWCQLDRQYLTQEALQEQQQTVQIYHQEQVKAAAEELKKFLTELLDTGLARTSPDVLDYLERLAIICHNAALPKLEGDCRNLSAAFAAYLKRMASFRTKAILDMLTRMYSRTCLLLAAQNDSEIAMYAGQFKSEYFPAGTLHLIGIAAEHFEGRSGYEGDTCYFLEENNGRWYTYTNSRPMFYEKRQKGALQKAQAPWGLSIAIEDLATVRLRLEGAKVNDTGRLSASGETKGEIVGERKLLLQEIRHCCYKDFKELFDKVLMPAKQGWLYDSREGAMDNFVFLQPTSLGEAIFEKATQRLSLLLLDEKGNEVIIEMAYSKQEASAIRYLERISKRLVDSKEEIPYFLGTVYLKESKIMMYPVACLEKEAFSDGPL